MILIKIQFYLFKISFCDFFKIKANLNHHFEKWREKRKAAMENGSFDVIPLNTNLCVSKSTYFQYDADLFREFFIIGRVLARNCKIINKYVVTSDNSCN